MNFISRDNHIFSFSKDNRPCLSVNPGDTVVFETFDCFSNQIKGEFANLDEVDFSQVNPATGPVYIDGAKKGQVLKVKIESIELTGNSVGMSSPFASVLKDHIDERFAKVMSIEDNNLLFNNIKIPLKKMIGVIGVAPESEPVNCGTPGNHGGNMDCLIIGEGSTVYFPIFNDGALFSLGDIHAVMGDGEISISGAETPAKVTVTFDIIDSSSIKNPVVETENSYYTIASALTLDDAYVLACEDMFDLLSKKSELSSPEIILLLSLVGNLEVCQVVDPLKTMRFRIDKSSLNQLNISSLL